MYGNHWNTNRLYTKEPPMVLLRMLFSKILQRVLELNFFFNKAQKSKILGFKFPSQALNYFYYSTIYIGHIRRFIMSTILMSKNLWNSSLALIYHMQFIQTGQLSAAYQFKLK